MKAQDIEIISQIYDWSQQYKHIDTYKKDLAEFLEDLAKEENTSASTIFRSLENIDPTLAAGVHQVLFG